MKKRVRHEVYIFLLSFFFRTIIIFGFLHPNNYLRFLPYQNMIRAEILINTGKVYFPDAWSSYYLFLGLIYQLFKFFGLYAYKNTALVIFNIFIASIAFVILGVFGLGVEIDQRIVNHSVCHQSFSFDLLSVDLSQHPKSWGEFIFFLFNNRILFPSQ